MATPNPALPAWQTIAFDGVPIFRGLALALQDARNNGWRGTLVSADRRPGVAERFGHASQEALWLGWQARKPGFNPANPPGRSTHELRSDGVAYRGPVGRKIANWGLGMDVTEWDQLLAILRRLGYSIKQPYSSGSEEHHVNFMADPVKHARARLAAHALRLRRK